MKELAALPPQGCAHARQPQFAPTIGCAERLGIISVFLDPENNNFLPGLDPGNPGTLFFLLQSRPDKLFVHGTAAGLPFIKDVFHLILVWRGCQILQIVSKICCLTIVLTLHCFHFNFAQLQAGSFLVTQAGAFLHCVPRKSLLIELQMW